MALYRDQNSLTHSMDPAFDFKHKPGTSAPYPGIYRCTSCGSEIAIAGGHIFPPQNHFQHNPLSGPIFWQLLVYPISK